jgi:hypothetical protein
MDEPNESPSNGYPTNESASGINREPQDQAKKNIIYNAPKEETPNPIKNN